MAQLLTEYAWGTILLFLSTLHIIAYLSRAYGWRRVALFCVFLFWIGIEVQFVLSNPWSTSTWTYGWIAAAYGYIYIVLERDARTES